MTTTGRRMDRGIAIPIDIRRYRDADEPAILELLRATLGAGPGGVRSAELFRWKHLRNPFGRSFMLVAEARGRIVGFRAFMPWRFESGDTVVRAVRAVDTATHPDVQRMGVFSRLTTRALQDLRGQTDLVFNTPNARSGPGYLKLGWRSVGRVTASVRVLRPLRFFRGLPSTRAGSGGITGPQIPVEAETALEALADEQSVSSLLERAGAPTGRLATPKDPAFLRWRYGEPGALDYHAVRETRHGHLVGLVLFRVRGRGALVECSIADVIAGERDVHTAATLLRRAVRVAPVDHAAIRAPSSTTAARAAIRSGFVPTPGGVTLVVNAITEGLAPDPTDRRSWALSLGDLEVF